MQFVQNVVDQLVWDNFHNFVISFQIYSIYCIVFIFRCVQKMQLLGNIW